MDGAFPIDEIEKHFWLTRSVARVLQINLSEAMAEGYLTETGYAEMVTRCRASCCENDCANWLANETGFPRIAPEHCSNAKCLNRLRQIQHPDDYRSTALQL